MYLVLTLPKRARRTPHGPIVIVDGRDQINLIDGRASIQQPRPPPKGRFPKTIACDVCGTAFEATGGNSAYCSKDCQRERIAERRVEDEMYALRARKGRASR